MKRPQLGQHVFATTDLAPDPFVKTYVRNSVGIGKLTGLDLPLVVIADDTVIGLAGDLFFAILEFEYQHAVKDWIAIHGGVKVAGRIGTGVQSLLASGITAGAEFEVGWLVKLIRSQRAALSGALNLNNGQLTTINLLGFVDDLLAGEEASLVRNTPALRGSGGLRFAYGFSRLFGVNLSSDLGYGESVDRNAGSDRYYRVAGYGSFNLGGSTAIPLGFTFGGKIESFPASENIDDNVAEVLMRIAYTGRDDFTASLDLSYGDQAGSYHLKGVKLGAVRFSLRYYF